MKNETTVAIYARVSTLNAGQDPNMQTRDYEVRIVSHQIERESEQIEVSVDISDRLEVVFKT